MCIRDSKTATFSMKIKAGESLKIGGTDYDVYEDGSGAVSYTHLDVYKRQQVISFQNLIHQRYRLTLQTMAGQRIRVLRLQSEMDFTTILF